VLRDRIFILKIFSSVGVIIALFMLTGTSSAQFEHAGRGAPAAASSVYRLVCPDL
jgi:hypothetical protein